MNQLFTTVEQVALKTASEWAVHYHLAMRCISNKKYDRALVNLNKALECPGCDNVKVLLMIIQAQYRKGSYAEAIEACDRMELHSANVTVDLLLWRARSLTKLGNYEQAQQYLNQALGKDSSNPDIHAQIGDMHRLKGDLKEAQHAFGHAFELNRGCIAALLGMGRCWLVLKDYPKALKCFDKVLELNYQHVDCLLEKGRVLQQLGREAEAMQCYKRMLALDSSTLKKLQEMGVQVSEFENQTAIMEEEDPEQYFNRSTDLRRKGNFEQALKMINQALRLLPDEPLYLCNRSLIHSKLGNDRLARQDIIRATELFSEHSSTKETPNHQLLRNATQQYATLMNKVEETKFDNPIQKQVLASIRTSANITFNKSIETLFEPATPGSQALLQRLMQEMSEMRQQLERIEAENKSMKVQMSQHDSRLNNLEKHVDDVLLPLKERIFPRIQIDRRLERMKKEDPKRYYYVIALHQCINCYLQSMRLILSGLFKVENPHTNLFAMTVIKGTLGLSKHLPVVGELVEAIGELFLGAIEYRNEEKFKETQSKFNRLLKPFKTEQQISYEVLEAVVQLSARPPKALQIKNVVTYIEVDKRKHPAKAIIDKAKNSFMKIKEEINGRILHIHEREVGITRDEYSLTLVSTQDLLFFLEYVFRTNLGELPELHNIIRQKMCETTEQDFQELRKEAAKQENPTPIKAPEVEEPKALLDRMKSLVALRNAKAGEYLTYNNGNLIRLVKEQANCKKWTLIRCSEKDPELFQLFREDESAYLSEISEQVTLKVCKKDIEPKPTTWRVHKKTLKDKQGYTLQSVTSNLYAIGKLKEKKPFFSFCSSDSDPSESNLQLKQWKDNEQFLWQLVERPSSINKQVLHCRPME